jgi:SAM-dependent methyltransferase
MTQYVKPPKQTWNESFEEAIRTQSYNTAPVEALVRNIAYYFRKYVPENKIKNLHFLELGCGAGPNLLWLAKKGIRVSGIDISPLALKIARHVFEEAKLCEQIGRFDEGSVTETPYEDESFDGILEACVFQHLDKSDRIKAFEEVKRLLKPGGVFVGYMLGRDHTVFQKMKAKQIKDDPGTIILNNGSSKVHLTNIGLTHFYDQEELVNLFSGFSLIDPCLTTYYLPREEAEKRGYMQYLQSMWAVYAIK